MAVQSFEEFLKKQGAKTQNVGSDKFQQFLQNKKQNSIQTKNSTQQSKPAIKQDGKKETGWQWFTKQLMKPVGATSEALETVGRTTGALILPAISKKVTAKQGLEMAGKELKQGVIDIKDVATGKKITSYSEKISSDVKAREQAGQKVSTLEKALGNVFGIGSDLILDPLNKVDLTKAVSTFGKITKLDRVVGAGAKVTKDIVGNIPVTATKNVDDVAKELRGMFSNKTGNKEFDQIVTKFRNLRAYREGEYFDQAVDLQKRINTFARQSGQKPEAVQRVIRDALEDNSIIPSLPAQLRDEVMTLKTTYKDALKATKDVGLNVKEIAEYAPRIRTKDSSLNKVQSIAGGAKEFSKGSVEKGRKAFIEVIDEGGTVIPNKANELGLKKINKELFINKIEATAAKKINRLQKSLEHLAKNDIKKATAELEDLVKTLKVNTSKGQKMTSLIDDAVIEPTEKELNEIINGLVGKRKEELTALISKLKDEAPLSQGLEFNKPILGNKISRAAKIKQLNDEIIKTQNEIAKDIARIQGSEFIGRGGKFYNTKMMTQSAIETLDGGKYASMFEKNPAIQLAVKGQTYAKAVTAKEFADAVSKFATDDGVEVANSLFKDKKFAPEIAKVIDNYYTSIKPEELNVVLKGFDNVQNLWKAQILVSPAYHMRNVAGNLWNNYLAGVFSPAFYAKANAIQKNPTQFADELSEIKKLGILGKGQYGGDIPGQISSIGNKKILQRINPFSRSNDALELNKKVGSYLEDNAKIAHYLSKRAQGLSPEMAAESVKKFLFDYDDLTKFEKTILKRAAPFYTWTRKNIPLQLEQIVKQPGKYAQVAKVQESIERGTEKPNEKFMSQYLRDNIPVRIRKNKEGDTEYFLMGNWLPAASAIDFLSQPMDNIIGMLSPIPKTIYEQMANESLYFKTTTGDRQEIAGEGEFLGMSMDKQAINMLRNIRVLGDIDKLFDKKNKTEEENSWLVKSLNLLFGRAGTYDVNKSKYFYDKDTKDKVQEYETKIRQASKIGDKNRVKELKGELKDFVKSRR